MLLLSHTSEIKQVDAVGWFTRIFIRAKIAHDAIGIVEEMLTWIDDV